MVDAPEIEVFAPCVVRRDAAGTVADRNIPGKALTIRYAQVASLAALWLSAQVAGTIVEPCRRHTGVEGEHRRLRDAVRARAAVFAAIVVRLTIESIAKKQGSAVGTSSGAPRTPEAMFAPHRT